MSEPQSEYSCIRYPDADEELDDELSERHQDGEKALSSDFDEETLSDYLSTDFRPVCRHEWKWRTSTAHWFEFFCRHCGAVLTKEQVCEILGERQRLYTCRTQAEK